MGYIVHRLGLQGEPQPVSDAFRTGAGKGYACTVRPHLAEPHSVISAKVKGLFNSEAGNPAPLPFMNAKSFWIPAFAGMTREFAGMRSESVERSVIGQGRNGQAALTVASGAGKHAGRKMTDIANGDDLESAVSFNADFGDAGIAHGHFQPRLGINAECAGDQVANHVAVADK